MHIRPGRIEVSCSKGVETCHLFTVSETLHADPFEKNAMLGASRNNDDNLF